jgi:hypothetical protein
LLVSSVHRVSKLSASALRRVVREVTVSSPASARQQVARVQLQDSTEKLAEQVACLILVPEAELRGLAAQYGVVVPLVDLTASFAAQVANHAV